MKRDMELIRTILLVVEEQARGDGWLELEPDDTPGKTPEEVAYHIRLLRDARFLDAIDRSTLKHSEFFPQRLTWEGHEFLDAIRNDSVWMRIKKTVADKGGSIPFEVLKELAKAAARDYFLGDS